MSIATTTLEYQQHNQTFAAYIAYDTQLAQQKKLPTVLIAHAWDGRSAFEDNKATALAELGYVGIALDVYGKGKLGKTVEEKTAFMQPLMQNRQMLHERVTAAFTAVKQLSMVDSSKMAVIGFCFGGLTALDMLRIGLPLKGVVSFHGLLKKPETKIKTSVAKNSAVLVLHGYNDPMVSPQDVQTFCEEMQDLNVDWQVHMYSHTKHAFMNPQANDQQLGIVYNPQTEHRAWLAMQNFLTEILS